MVNGIKALAQQTAEQLKKGVAWASNRVSTGIAELKSRFGGSNPGPTPTDFHNEMMELSQLEDANANLEESIQSRSEVEYMRADTSGYVEPPPRPAVDEDKKYYAENMEMMRRAEAEAEAHSREVAKVQEEFRRKEHLNATNESMRFNEMAQEQAIELEKLDSGDYDDADVNVIDGQSDAVARTRENRIRIGDD